MEAYGYEEVELSMFGIHGRRILSAQASLIQGLNQLTYPLDSHLVKGIFILTVTGKGEPVSAKLLL
ncbi:MAG: hypothetical protein ABFS10_14190 [Bacteroidota bacterium]